jgi:hypothetical protein
MADTSIDIDDHQSTGSLSAASKKANILSSLNSLHSTPSSSPRLSLTDLQQTLNSLREFISSARTHIQQDPTERRRVSVAVASAMKLIEAEEGEDSDLRSGSANDIIRETLMQEGYTSIQADSQIQTLKEGGELKSNSNTSIPLSYD